MLCRSFRAQPFGEQHQGLRASRSPLATLFRACGAETTESLSCTSKLSSAMTNETWKIMENDILKMFWSVPLRGSSGKVVIVDASFRTLARRANRPAVLPLVLATSNSREATSVAFSNGVKRPLKRPKKFFTDSQPAVKRLAYLPFGLAPSTAHFTQVKRTSQSRPTSHAKSGSW